MGDASRIDSFLCQQDRGVPLLRSGGCYTKPQTSEPMVQVTVSGPMFVAGPDVPTVARSARAIAMMGDLHKLGLGGVGNQQ